MRKELINTTKLGWVGFIGFLAGLFGWARLKKPTRFFGSEPPGLHARWLEHTLLIDLIVTDEK